MDPRAIALQGLGYTPLLVAVQGFAPVPVLDRVNGGGRYTDEDIRRLVEEKWAAIEAAQHADRAQKTGVSPTRQAPSVEISADLEQVARAAAPLEPSALLPSARPLLPDAAERAREARRRNDEEALILLLTELL